MILIVDDEPWILEEMLEALSLSGHDALAACNVPEALAVLESRDDVDLVVTDIRMPVQSGWDLIRHFEDKPGPKFVVVTGHEIEDEGATRNGYNIAAWLKKPIAARELIRAIEQAVLT